MIERLRLFARIISLLKKSGRGYVSRGVAPERGEVDGYGKEKDLGGRARGRRHRHVNVCGPRSGRGPAGRHGVRRGGEPALRVPGDVV